MAESAAIFHYDVLKCVRTDYAFAGCSQCHDICPEKAFVFRNNKLQLQQNHCTGCGACIGGCPSEALTLATFDENQFALDFSHGKETVISCEKNGACLGAFDAEHYATMLIGRQSAIQCDLSGCRECELNGENRVLPLIRHRIDEANRFVASLGLEGTIEPLFQKPDTNPRRDFFKRLAKVAVATSVPKPETTHINPTTTPVPLKRTILKNALKTVAESIAEVTLETPFDFLGNQAIDKERCTHCGDCVSFCPTGALFADDSGEKIYFQTGKCITCDICHQICKPDAITNDPRIEAVSLAFDKAKLLVHHTIAVCDQCKCAFVQKEAETTCPQCRTFNDDFADMFKPAYLLNGK